MASLVIRPEIPQDFEAIRRVNRDAFGQDDEARIVDALRDSPAFIPELSLVALDGSRVVGHILFTRVAVREEGRSHEALALAPMAVEPAMQNRGIGSALVRRGLDDARRLGHGVVIVLGHPAYYPRFGFVRGSVHGIRPPFEAPDEAFGVLELRGGALSRVRGVVDYPPELSG